jgi:hypothetical protein
MKGVFVSTLPVSVQTAAEAGPDPREQAGAGDPTLATHKIDRLRQAHSHVSKLTIGDGQSGGTSGPTPGRSGRGPWETA